MGSPSTNSVVGFDSGHGHPAGEGLPVPRHVRSGALAKEAAEREARRGAEDAEHLWSIAESETRVLEWVSRPTNGTLS